MGKEKIGEYARAVGEDNPVYFDRERPARPGFRDVRAADVRRRLLGRLGRARRLDPEVGINFAMMVHGGPGVRLGRAGCAGDPITTEASVKDIYEKDGMGFYVFESVSTNQDGQEVVRGTWTNIVRGVSWTSS